MIGLYQNEKGLSAKTLCGTIGVNMEELENYIMPLLLINNFVYLNRHFIEVKLARSIYEGKDSYDFIIRLGETKDRF